MSTAITDQGHVIYEIKNNIATIEFFHPLSNSLPGKILGKLAQTITDLGNNNEVTVIVLKSAGERAFCAGASFDELISIKDLDTGKTFFSGFAKVINAARKCQKLIIIGKKDSLIDSSQLINEIKNTDIEFVEFSEGHMSHIENESDLSYFLLRFVENLHP